MPPRCDEVTHEGLGCSISQASTSVMSDLVTGRPLDDAMHATTSSWR